MADRPAKPQKLAALIHSIPLTRKSSLEQSLAYLTLKKRGCQSWPQAKHWEANADGPLFQSTSEQVTQLVNLWSWVHSAYRGGGKFYPVLKQCFDSSASKFLQAGREWKIGSGNHVDLGTLKGGSRPQGLPSAQRAGLYVRSCPRWSYMIGCMGCYPHGQSTLQFTNSWNPYRLGTICAVIENCGPRIKDLTNSSLQLQSFWHCCLCCAMGWEMWPPLPILNQSKFSSFWHWQIWLTICKQLWHGVAQPRNILCNVESILARWKAIVWETIRKHQWILHYSDALTHQGCFPNCFATGRTKSISQAAILTQNIA